MGAKAARAPLFPTTCACCGGRLSEPVSYCPHCGVQARLAFGVAAPAKRPRVAMAAAGAGATSGTPLHQVLWPSPPTPLFDSPEKDPYGEVRPPAPAPRQRAFRLPSSRLRLPVRIKTNTALTLSAFGALLAFGVFLHRHNDAVEHEQKLASSTVQGSVTAAGGVAGAGESSLLPANTPPEETAKPVQSPRNTPPANEISTATSAAATPAIAPAAVGASAAAHASALSAATVPPVAPDVNGDGTAKRQSDPTDSVAAIERAPSRNPSGQTAGSSSARSQPEPPSSARATAGDKRYGDKNRRLMALALARAHTGLQNNDLRMARSGVFWALSLQHDNSEALALKQELLARERAATGAREKAAASVRQ